jgi:hypothetical protein
MAKRKTVKRKTTRKRAPKGPTPTWSRWVLNTYGPTPDDLCSEGKAALTFAQIMERKGASPEEVWQAAPDAWKQEVVNQSEDVDSVDGQGLRDALENVLNTDAADNPKDSLTSAERKVVEAAFERLAAIADDSIGPDLIHTPVLGVEDGTVVVVKWVEGD